MRKVRAVLMVAVGVALVGFAVVPPALGSPITLWNGNSWARFWTDSPLGNDIWVVDGWNALRTQWFWYRVDGPTGLGQEASLDTLDASPTVVVTDTDGDSLDDNLRVTYLGGRQGLEVEINYNLMGGTIGSGRSDIAETIRLVNIGNEAQTVHFFQYVDFILSYNEDTVLVRWPNTAAQWFGSIHTSEAVVTPTPSHYEVNDHQVLLDALNDALPTTLSDSAGPLTGDVAWAFQWDFTLPPGGCALISKDKALVWVPEPATLALLGLGGAGLLIRRRRGR